MRQKMKKLPLFILIFFLTATVARAASITHGWTTTQPDCPTCDVSSHNFNDHFFTPATGDYTASQVTNTPAGDISSTTVQGAINELDTEKAAANAVVSSFNSRTGAVAPVLGDYPWYVPMSDLLPDDVVSGLLPATSATLTSNISAGVAHIGGNRITSTTTQHTYTAQRYTYVDYSNAGTFTFIESAANEILIDDGDTVGHEWTPNVSGVTCTLATDQVKVGAYSQKIVMTATNPPNAGDLLAYLDLPTVDLSSARQIKLWIRVSASCSSSLSLVLSKNYGCTTQDEVLVLPSVVTANQWKQIVVNLAHPDQDTAIVSVGLKQTSDIGARSIWLDDIQAVKPPVSQYIEASSFPLTSNSVRIARVTTDTLGILSVLPYKNFEINSYGNIGVGVPAAQQWSSGLSVFKSIIGTAAGMLFTLDISQTVNLAPMAAVNLQMNVRTSPYSALPSGIVANISQVDNAAWNGLFNTAYLPAAFKGSFDSSAGTTYSMQQIAAFAAMTKTFSGSLPSGYAGFLAQDLTNSNTITTYGLNDQGNTYGVFIKGNATGYGIWLDRSGAGGDIQLGGGKASIVYDGSNLVINPKISGSGIVSVLGTLDATSLTIGGTTAATIDASSLTSGTLDGNRLPALSSAKRGGVAATGTPSGKFYRDDDSWQTITIPADISGASFWTKVNEAGLSNEIALGTLSSGLILNTTSTGVPTIYGGTSCINQFPRSLNSSGAATCASVGDTDFSGTLTQGKGGTGAGALTCTNQFVTSNGTAYSCATDTLAGAQHANQGTTTTILHGNAAGNPAWGGIALADFTANQGTTTQVLHGNAAGQPAWGAIVGADLPNPEASTLGGVKSLTCSGTDKLSAIGTNGLPVCSADQTSASGGGKALFYASSSASLSANAYCNLQGYDVCGTSTTESRNQTRVPFTGTLKNLYAWFDVAQASGDSCTFYVYSGTCRSALASTGITCNISTSPYFECSDTTNTAAVTAGQCIQIFFNEVAGTCAGFIFAVVEIDPS